jgi:hypothetical protein
MIKYRFKTEQEMINCFGSRWRNNMQVYFALEMDYLLGQDFTENINEDFLKGWETINIININGDDNILDYWSIHFDHLIEYKEKPNYKQKILVY